MRSSNSFTRKHPPGSLRMVPLQQQQRSSIDSVDQQEQEEAARQERIFIDNNAGYLRASRARSSELHGVVYIDTETSPSTMQQQQQPATTDPEDQGPYNSGSSSGSADAGVVLAGDMEGGTLLKTGRVSPAGAPGGRGGCEAGRGGVVRHPSAGGAGHIIAIPVGTCAYIAVRQATGGAAYMRIVWPFLVLIPTTHTVWPWQPRDEAPSKPWVGSLQAYVPG